MQALSEDFESTWVWILFQSAFWRAFQTTVGEHSAASWNMRVSTTFIELSLNYPGTEPPVWTDSMWAGVPGRLALLSEASLDLAAASRTLLHWRQPACSSGCSPQPAGRATRRGSPLPKQPSVCDPVSWQASTGTSAHAILASMSYYWYQLFIYFHFI